MKWWQAAIAGPGHGCLVKLMSSLAQFWFRPPGTFPDSSWESAQAKASLDEATLCWKLSVW